MLVGLRNWLFNIPNVLCNTTALLIVLKSIAIYFKNAAFKKVRKEFDDTFLNFLNFIFKTKSYEKKCTTDCNTGYCMYPLFM